MKYLFMVLLIAVVSLAGCGKGDVTKSGWYCMGCKEPVSAPSTLTKFFTKKTCPNCGANTFLFNDTEDLTRGGGESSR